MVILSSSLAISALKRKISLRTAYSILIRVVNQLRTIKKFTMPICFWLGKSINAWIRLKICTVKSAGTGKWKCTGQSMTTWRVPFWGYTKLSTISWLEETHRNISKIMASAKKIQRFSILTTKSVYRIVSQVPFSIAIEPSTDPGHFKAWLFQISTIFCLALPIELSKYISIWAPLIWHQ